MLPQSWDFKEDSMSETRHDPANPFDPAKMVVGYKPADTTMPEKLKKEKTVTMVFPHKVSLQLDDGAGLIHFAPGVQEVPESLEGHWYIQQNKAVRYTPPEAIAPKYVMPAVTERHVKFLRANGYAIGTLNGARAYAEALEGKERAAFFAEAADWEEPAPVAIVEEEEFEETPEKATDLSEPFKGRNKVAAKARK
jgi:hypothetical protein